MHKINFKQLTSYAEETQPNSLQWAILSQEKDGSYTQVSAWIICKDFFNDLAYTIQTGKDFSIYGFNAGKMNPPAKDQPVYMVLRNFTPTFVQNVDKVNDFLAKQGLSIVKLSHADDKHLLLEWNPWFFSNTYYISLMSLIIRLCNYGHTFNSFTDIVTTKDFPYKDQQKWNAVVKKNVFFALPEKLKGFVWYYNESSNSNCAIDNYRIPGLVHNCGVLSWQQGF